MAVLVRIPTPLRKYTDGKAEVEVEGATIREVFDRLEAAHQGIWDRVFDDTSEVRRFISVFVNGEDIRGRSGVNTRVEKGDEVSVVPAIAGGA